jgi:hypothetical protein
MKTLRTAREVIAALGGNAIAAHITGRGYTAASNWGVSNSFPPNTCELMTAELRSIGCVADKAANLWQMVQPK